MSINIASNRLDFHRINDAALSVLPREPAEEPAAAQPLHQEPNNRATPIIPVPIGAPPLAASESGDEAAKNALGKNGGGVVDDALRDGVSHDDPHKLIEAAPETEAGATSEAVGSDSGTKEGGLDGSAADGNALGMADRTHTARQPAAATRLIRLFEAAVERNIAALFRTRDRIAYVDLL